MGRMHLTFRFTLILTIFTLTTGLAQKNTGKGCKPPISRQLFHDYIDREQRNTLRSDGKADDVFYISQNEEVNYLITQSIVHKIDAMQCQIEKDTLTSDQKKVTYLRGIERLLRNFIPIFRARKVNASQLPTIIDAYDRAMGLDKIASSIEPVIEKAGYDAGNLVVGSGAFDNNMGFAVARNIVLRKYMALHPEKIFPTLKNNPDFPYRDSLILIAAYKYPSQLYDYAAANNRLATAIRSINDPLVMTVTKMARSKGSGQIYFPFLDNILKGNQTLEDIDAVKDDPVKYYKLLVKTRIDYVNRLIAKEQVREMRSLEERLESKAKQVFIQTINGLHESPDPVRFKILNQLNPQELYYLAVFGEDELYTSSFVRGVFPVMMQKIGNRGDSLLMTVSFDRFKKFIKISAGYNTLSKFLNSFPDQVHAEKLMIEFVSGLEKTTTLEDGVDVADSYASIAESIKPLAEKMLENVKANYEKNVARNNHRGIIIYDLLYKLFLSADSAVKPAIDLSKEFGIPPVYNVAYQSLVNDKGNVTMQMFFYGDKDGHIAYNSFIAQMREPSWKKKEDTKHWVAFAKGNLTVYANKWTDDEKQPGEIEKSLEAIANYFEEKEIMASVIVHRGHSYWVSGTIERITPAAKIVLLGSCGGYNVIHDVLKHSPDAHIVASKQTGKLSINEPFFNLLNDKLTSGSNIDWLPFWGEFKAKAGKIEGFEDYIPPYKNLGALFIKAYNSKMGITDATF
jgi:hypothetical protein